MCTVRYRAYGAPSEQPARARGRLTFARIWVDPAAYRRPVTQPRGDHIDRLTEIGTAVDPRGHPCRARRRRVACAMGVDDAGLADSPGSGRAPARRVAGREFQRQAGGAALRQRLHRRGLSQRAAGTGEGSRRGFARQLPARALHQQPRERVGAGRLSGGRAGRQGRPQATTAACGGALRRCGEAGQAAGCDSDLLQRRPEKPASRPSPLRRPQRARQRGRQATAPAQQTPPPAAAPEPPAPAAPPEPPKPQWDIFD